VRLYLAVARLSLRRGMTYKAGAAAGVFTNTVFGFIRVYILLALWTQKPELGGYDAATYVFLAQGLAAALAVFTGTTELSPRIRTGEVAVDLYRPCDFQGYWLAMDLGRAGAQVALRAVPPILIGLLAFPMNLPVTTLPWLEFAICFMLALLVSFAIRYLVSVSGFWTMDERGMASALAVFALFFSGFLIPISIMPGWLASVADALPWSATVQLPINVLLGVDPAGFAAAIARQLAWAVGLLALGRVATVAAKHKVVVQGG
jgi:ABC-2 type transport system permease protein